MSDLKIPSRFTVKRSEWLRGVEIDESGHNPSLLLTVEGKRCCVGFLASAIGFDDAVLVHRGDMSDLMAPFDERDLPTGLEELSKGLESSQVYQTNDMMYMPDPERESLLTAKFAALGIAVEFVD